MLKIMALMKRNEDMTMEEFRLWVETRHPRLVTAIPGLLGYKVNVCLKDDPARPYDAVNELWFEKDAARVAGFSSKAGRDAAADAAAHCLLRTHLLVDEKEILRDSG
jgi:uncharacterized protein (TIGR02118 family)